MERVAVRRAQVRYAMTRRLSCRRARVRPLADRPNAVWTYDLIHDACTDGTPSKCLTVVDEFTALSPPQPSSHLTFDGRRAISMPVGNAPVTKANPAKAGSAKPRVLALLRDASVTRHEGPHDRRAAGWTACLGVPQSAQRRYDETVCNLGPCHPGRRRVQGCGRPKGHRQPRPRTES